MSYEMDKRVVEMQFDNKQFENNIRTSTKSLEKFKESLNLEDSAKGLLKFQNTGNKFNLSSMEEAAESVTKKFSFMGTIGDQVIRRITDASLNAYNRMRRLINSFTREPIYSGFSEYETQINAVQTILANTSDAMDKLGYSQQERLDIVNGKLDELNRYADKTIYNFTEMTRNIGTFTAAGVELNTAVSAIQGIANLGAISGSTSEQVSRGMYQMSQAISTGTMKLMDWNSVVNAGMGGEIFQKALLRTARVMGVTGKKAQEAYSAVVAGNMSFRDSLSSGWLTSDILTSTLEQMSWDFQTLAESMGLTVEEIKELKKADLLASGYGLEDVDAIISLAETATDAATKVKTFSQLLDTLKEAAQSGWTQTWEYVIGDFEKAKSFLTDVSKYFGALIDSSANARNAIVKEWSEQGGRSDLIKGFWNIVYAIQNVVSTAKREFQTAFPPATENRLLSITQKFKGATESFKAFTENISRMEAFKKSVRGAASALNVFRGLLTLIGRGFNVGFRLFGSFFHILFRISGSLSDYVRSVRESVADSEDFQLILKRLCDAANATQEAFDRGCDRISKFTNAITNSKILADIRAESAKFIGLVPEAINGFMEWTRAIETTIKSSERFQKALFRTKNFGMPVINMIRGAAISFLNAIRAFNNADVSSGENGLERLHLRLSASAEVLKTWGQEIQNAAKVGYENVKRFFTDLFDIQIPRFFQSRMFTTDAIASRLKSIDWGKVLKTYFAFKSVTLVSSAIKSTVSFRKMLRSLGETLEEFGDTLKDIRKTGLKKDSFGTTLLKIAGSISILVGSIYLLSKMDEGDVVKGIGIISLLGAELLTASVLFGKIRANGKNFMMVAAAVALLAIPIKLLGSMDEARAVKGIVAITAVLAGVGLCMRLAGKGFNNKAAFISLGIGLNLLVLAVNNLGKLDTDALNDSIIAFSRILLRLLTFMVVLKKTASGSEITGVVSIAIAMNLLVIAIRQIGKMDTESLIKGIAGLGTVMVAFGAMLKLSQGSRFKDAFVILSTMAGTLYLFSEIFNRIADIDSNKMLSFSESFAIAILALSTSMGVISKIPAVGILKSIAGISAVLLAMGALMTGVGALAKKFEWISGSIEIGGDILGLIGEGIGKFFGGIGRGIYKGFDLPGLGAELSAFMANAEGFISGISSLNTDGFDKLDGLVDAVKTTAKAGINRTKIADAVENFKTVGTGLTEYAASIEGVVSMESFFNIMKSVPIVKMLADTVNLLSRIRLNNAEMFPTSVEFIATALKRYSESIKGFSGGSSASEKDLELATTVANNLSKLMNSFPNTGGWLQKIVGFKNSESFAASIEKIGESLKAYSSSIKGFGSDSECLSSEADLKQATLTAKSLSELMNSLPSTGGWLQKIVGFKDFSLFSEGIKRVGNALKAYSASVKGFRGGDSASEEDLKLATTVADNLSKLLNSLPDTGGRLQEWMGWNDLSLFSKNIEKIGTSLMVYSESVKGISGVATKEDLSIANDTALALSKLNNSLPPTGSTIHKWLFGEQNLDLFSANIVTLGISLRSFAESIRGVSLDKSETAVSVLDVIRSFIEGLEGGGSIWDTLDKWLGEGDKIHTLNAYTTAIRKLGEDLHAFCNAMQNVDVNKVDVAQEVFEAFFAFVSGMESGGTIWQWFSNTFGKGSPFGKLETVAVSMANLGMNVEAFMNGTKDIHKGLERITMIQAMFNSVNDLMRNVEGFDTTLMSSIQMLLLGFSELMIPEFEAEGEASADAYLKSLNEKIQNGAESLTIVVIALSQSAISAANGTYQNWYATGQYLGAGIGKGIASMATVVNAQAVNVASGAIKSIAITWQVHSPSRVGENLGRLLDLGVAGGIDRDSHIVNRSAIDMSQRAVDSMSMVIRGLDFSTFNELNVSPKIRPVIDSSEVQRGVNSINGMFYSSPMFGNGLFKGASFSRLANALNFDGARILGGIDNKDVVSEIQSLSNRFDKLADAVANMNLVLDSGELVGRTSAKMDRQLGTIAMRKGRGN